MTPEAIRDSIPTIETRLDLLTLLNKIKRELYGDRIPGFSLNEISFYCNPEWSWKGYRRFSIPKKSGGFREIAAPEKALLSIQKCLSVIFQALYEPSPIATGFLPGMSVVDNASRHIGMNYVFNTDIKDFFPSINKGRIYRLLTLDRYGFRPEIALVVAGLCCMKVVRENSETGEQEACYVLPQGSPTSPILTNMVCHNLDRKLGGLAKRFNLKCSRYADDITFSSPHNVYSKKGKFRRELTRIIEGQHFALNEAKTRLQSNCGRREVTGLVVSDKVNVDRQYIRDLQSVLYIWERYGYDTAEERFSVYYRRHKPNEQADGYHSMKRVIHGKLMYLKMVKGEDDHVFRKLNSRFVALCTQDRSGLQEKSGCEFACRVSAFEEQFGSRVEFKKKARKGCDKPVLFATTRLDSKNIFIPISRNCSGKIAEAIGCPEAVESIKRELFIAMLCPKKGGRCWMILGNNPIDIQD